MHAASNYSVNNVTLPTLDGITLRRWLSTVIGVLSAFLLISLAACAPEPVYRTLPAAPVRLPASLTTPLAQPNCQFVYNADLGDCILKQRGVIDRANADRAAVRANLDRLQ
ncbi:hypothetical protein R84981_000968 [Carnimonas sp. R-84981]